jgi:hypothetical protein
MFSIQLLAVSYQIDILFINIARSMIFRKILKLFLYWLPFAFIITFFSVLIYIVVQQNIRLTANDPQIQMAEDLAVFYSKQKNLPLAASPNPLKIEITKSLATFIIIYKEDGKIFSSTGVVNGKLPELPKGVLDYSRTHDENRLTWEPQPNTRIAAVIHSYKNEKGNGFILVGRSLREVEKREDQLYGTCLTIWLLSLFGVASVLIFTKLVKQKLFRV